MFIKFKISCSNPFKTEKNCRISWSVRFFFGQFYVYRKKLQLNFFIEKEINKFINEKHSNHRNPSKC